jgi:hypothetical protein
MKNKNNTQGFKDRKVDGNTKRTVPKKAKDAKSSTLKKYPNRTGYHGTHDERSLNAEE